MNHVDGIPLKTDNKYFYLKGDEIFKSLNIEPTIEQRWELDQKLRRIACDTIDGYTELLKAAEDKYLDRFLKLRKTKKSFLSLIRSWIKK